MTSCFCFMDVISSLISLRTLESFPWSYRLLLVAFCVGVLAFRESGPFLGSPVKFACLLTCQGPWLRGWLGPAYCDTHCGGTWLGRSVQHPVGFFGSLWILQKNTSQTLAWLPVFKGPPVRGEGQDLSSGCAGTSSPACRVAFQHRCYWRPQGRDSGSLFQRG